MKMLTLITGEHAMKKTDFSRRKFFNRLIAVLAVPFLYFWYKEVKMSSFFEEKRVKIIPVKDIPEGITFYDEVIVSKMGERILVFSSHCTHLGCKIDSFKNNKLVCPCHGSEYSVHGEILKGPSARPLTKLKCRVDATSGKLLIYLT